MVAKKINDFIPYSVKKTDKDIKTIITNMMAQAQTTGKTAVFSFADLRLEITPKMTYEEGQNAWKQALN